MTGTVKADIDGNVCTLTISNPGKRNAIGYTILEELIEQFERLDQRDDYPVVVLTGEGDHAFSAGFDLSVDRTEQTEEQKELWPRMISTLEEYEYPTIAMINGDTYGGAMELISTCDLRVGVRGATFGITPAKIGLVYKGTSIKRVIDVVGYPYAKELLFTGEPIDSNRADEIGLLNHLTDRDELEETTYDLAETIAGNAPLSLKYMKKIFRNLEEKTTPSDLEQDWVSRVRDEAFKSADHEEGIRSFNAGDDPEFVGE
ncbi:Enoyl-CoA hydratase/carnithine racemase [Natronorubrum sediminis]|uniref:Enoyl-CoA hydratase/carnithine racemase n=1 Tax=Natronorubrum sediminis TaxID=640943 RepID=A0A1H6FTG6_9EURY|nr:enoyl-CoA hydratase-related protein [Natronorubrum sediminis]SEH13560.1 Enoyl-CoA hydratase/carnithine racemase [Natronorubrum sediminis]